MWTIFTVIVVLALIVACMDDGGPGGSAGANHTIYHSGGE
ncbi:hypothetical protein pEp_SNUABM10_00043 [Erwinia phage pEp_SNUABM_10]|uniref:Uncharacterized protein n=1 Tax=Erwinia phage pEp_SNUABM_09 TaxID=2601644 RepID=A0A5J6DA43_9CAUD|nr:hypothetical protein pEpSNUABM09_41 [Erwinia phage pEp_SNUABM_09]QOC57642.1 hypothetical protein pEp_SNUABM03_00040 [Erwinia phage pEp_SNUABM_03]QOC57697.1 hypothetical protein pEp_SNUABM04_00043 [Erwinia phage pEp_SNUABM_04]QOC57747.1 hypothetical protein pEp_SNUABM10_00043 [Erwinia phage pEp_SNUABM_10]QOC57799.1 hypothetical protein pEp_SNUABM11_00043 [Erwinia phage pEp_SNUABM_11]